MPNHSDQNSKFLKYQIPIQYLCAMTIEEKALAVEELFNQLDNQISSFQSVSGLHCLFGCGKCCFKPDIEATVLEFLPFALYLYKNNKAREWFEKLEMNNSSVCMILNPTQAGAGLCSEYPHRGLICRLFGYSARTDKYGKPEMVTCQIIKTDQKELYESAASKIEQGEMNIPLMNQFYMQLHSIDMDLAREFFPINKAIKKAIETVLHYYAYRDGN